LCFLGFREVLGDVFYIDEWPGKIISFAYGLEPGGFCWEACRAMEVSNGGFDAGEFIYVVCWRNALGPIPMLVFVR
jgi:hypothetical protein